MTTTITNHRINSIDVLRGIVMVIMALDHTRDFLHNQAMIADPLDPATTTIPVFFTRWITHFCAPVFVLLSGISAWLSAQNKPVKTISRFLMIRGVWLVIAEITIVTLAITFNPFFNVLILQVIWVIGWSMILLGALMRTSYKTILITGLVLLTGHNCLPYLPPPKEGAMNIILQVTFTSRGAFLPLFTNHFAAVLYAILPWTAIMLLGYCMGPWFAASVNSSNRQNKLRITGCVLIAVFIVLRTINHFGDLQPKSDFPTFIQDLFSFLNTTKYPPSLQYVCMTLGPALLLLSLLEKQPGVIGRFFLVYGRVPFFYYILHFYLIHFITVAVFFGSGYPVSKIADPQIPFLFRPADLGFSLPAVYVIWILVVLSLYYPCKWFNRYKRSHDARWLKFV